MAYNSRKKIMPIEKILYSIDNLLIEGKEQKLKGKLAKKIRNGIFTEDILSKLHECDFTGLIDEEDNVLKLFESIFPIFIKKGNTIFRLYKHKIEVDLSDEMRDRYIYMLSDGRLTSGLFQCYSISQDEYVYGIKKIIDVIPLIKEELMITISNFRNNIEKQNVEINNIKEREELAEKNYKELSSYFLEKNSNNQEKL
ncbi:hypothetical protein [Clostridium butyricum]|uniref:Uncharacterized protein n=1 Tax=Clostridium butyricum E4 str. BoNT E BL5262 TaxID=632245 RepID=C4ICH2_CLOBU|nr:hypothetical protein [Clostridium butyricum]EDT76188.1 conserved hypothetical protein [Clostridium butyricum 5521]EEP56271.1 conserved hypothetical protein [Clostridium butyricum E4 str. BoNT E BL5262]NFL33197.1 hypothetical protein [Clostridium butyricum]NFS16684.1 hypothetical protein [Clostridium butyricum]